MLEKDEFDDGFELNDYSFFRFSFSLFHFFTDSVGKRQQNRISRDEGGKRGPLRRKQQKLLRVGFRCNYFSF